jgi:diguanylate cyclase (GGDEF)-like protein/PAS domain S-box-containing protein
MDFTTLATAGKPALARQQIGDATVMRFPSFRTIRSHLLLLVLISVLPAWGIIIYSGLDRSSREIEDAKSNALEVVRSLGYEHERVMGSTRQFLMTLAKIPDIQKLNIIASNQLLEGLLKQNPLYGGIFVLNAQGILCSSAPPFKQTSMASSKFFQDVVRTRDFSVGEYAICQSLNRPVLHLGYPITDAEGKFKGMVGISLDIARYARMFSMENLPQGSTLSISDHRGILLYVYPENGNHIPTTDLPDMIGYMSHPSYQRREGVFTYTGVDDLKRLNAYRRFRLKANESAYLFIRVDIPENKALHHAKRALLINVVLLSVAFLIVVFSAWFFGNAIIVKRLNKLVEASRKIEHGDLKTRTGLDHKPDELGEVARVFDEMAEALETKNAEHEQAEEKLKKTADQWQTTFDSITDLVMILDRECRIVRVNEGAVRFFNRPMNNIIGKQYFTLLFGTEKLPEQYPYERMMGTRQHEETEIYLAEKGIWLYVSVDPVLDGNGNVLDVVYIAKDITDRKRAENALRLSEERFRELYDHAPIGYHEYDIEGRITNVSLTDLEMLGYTREEMVGHYMWEFNVEAETVRRQVLEKLEGSKPADQDIERIYRRKDGTTFPVLIKDRIILNEQGKITGIRCTIQDITHRKRAEERLRESEERFRELAENIREVFYIYEEEIFRYISPAYAEIWGCPPQRLYEDPKSFWETVHPEDKNHVKRFLEKKGQQEVEVVYRIVRPDRSIRWIRDRSFPIGDDSGRTHRIVGIAADITDLKLGEEKLRYLSLHDPLTGLYNRIYFEEEMRRIEKTRHGHETIGILSCDLDGLKLVNDTLGHDQGDRLLVAAARVIRDSFREGDLAARIGGDEFAVVLPNTTEPAVENACQRIQEAVAVHNATTPELPLSISVGFSIKNGSHKNLKDVFKEADNHMYRKKLYRTQSVRSTIVSTLINTLRARDLATDRHASRLEKLLVRMAALIGLPESTTADLSLLAKFHDIGKVGISDAILLKEGLFTSEEWTEMKRHCEIGYRIALSAQDLVPIADWILKHHEWWDGQGYPLGIKGEEIPVECRLLAIADAYEALTSARPYRRTFSHREAVAELRRHAGTQFDPHLLEKFVKMLQTHFPEAEPTATSTV